MSTDVQLEKLQRDDHDTLIRVETKLEGLTAEIRDGNNNMKAMIADHELRIRVLENDKEQQAGVSSGTDKVRSTIFAIAGLLVGALSVWALLHK